MQYTKMNIKIVAIGLASVLILISLYTVYTQVNEHFMRDDPKLQEIEEIFTQFFANKHDWKAPLDSLSNRDVMKEIKLYRGKTSYTINKEKVYICLKDPKGEYYNNNMLVYVLAHELSHVICNSVGHTDEFQTIFDALLRELVTAGIFDPKSPIDESYCLTGDSQVPE